MNVYHTHSIRHLVVAFAAMPDEAGDPASTPGGGGSWEAPKAQAMPPLQQIFAVQQTIQDIHPFLEKLFPIAIVKNEQFFIYDVDPNGQRYRLVKEVATPMPIPDKVRAAFPLDSYDDRMVCVVTGDVFDETAGYVTIFHEFIHCQQFERGEQQVKQTLGLARKAQAANDFMWELNHSFPYAAPDFMQTYQSFLEKWVLEEMLAERKHLKNILSPDDYDYMVWQEWKEGFARFIENQIRRRLGLPENHGGRDQPFNRVLFYAGGAHFIQALGQQEPQLTTDIEELFNRMFHP